MLKNISSDQELHDRMTVGRGLSQAYVLSAILLSHRYHKSPAYLSVFFSNVVRHVEILVHASICWSPHEYHVFFRLC